MKHNIGIDVSAMIEGMPTGLERSVLRVLSYHVGRDSAISRAYLLKNVRSVMAVDDRTLRLAVNQLRKAGVMICSTGGKNGGYWLAASPKELNDYLDNEVRARLKDLAEQDRALTAAGKAAWGEGIQMTMTMEA